MEGDIVVQSRLGESYRTRIRASKIRLAQWSGAWLAATFLTAFGPRFIWDKAVAFTVLAVALGVATGFGMILATKDYLAEVDELQKKIYLSATGTTLGVTLVVGIGYESLDTYGVIPFHFSFLVILMNLTFMVALRHGARRYR